MARNIPVGHAYKLRVNIMRVNANEHVDFEKIMLTCLCLRY